MKTVPLLAFTIALVAGCGDDHTDPPPADDAPDAGEPTPEPEPDAGVDPGVEIGVGDPVCQGHADPDQAVDIGPVLPDEAGDLAAARITPPSYPFEVTSVSYKLTGQTAVCGTDIAHAVRVFAAPTADAPPAEPADVQRIEVDGAATDERARIVTLPLDTPIVLEDGEDLFVAIEMAANQALTVAVCLDGCAIQAEDRRQFWSTESEAPHSWATLYSYGIAQDYAIWATGEAR
jgi:hypothetical protein